jgi:hypothetical protein
MAWIQQLLLFSLVCLLVPDFMQNCPTLLGNYFISTHLPYPHQVKLLIAISPASKLACGLLQKVPSSLNTIKQWPAIIHLHSHGASQGICLLRPCCKPARGQGQRVRVNPHVRKRN